MATEVDFNQLPLLLDLMKTKNMGRVAVKYGKTTSAISKSLAKLRLALNDELFIKTSTGLEPTDYMVSIYPSLEQTIQQLGFALQQEKFDPLQYDHKLVIAVSPALIKKVGILLYQKLSKAAPNAKLVLHTWDEQTEEKINNNEVNAGIHLIGPKRGQSLYPRIIHQDISVLFMRKGHPAMSFEQALAYPMALYKIKGWNDLRYINLDRIRQQGFNVRCPIEVDDVSLFLDVVKHTDHIGIFTKSLLDDNFTTLAMPEPLKINIDIAMYVKSAYRNSALNQWLFSLLKEVMQQTKG